MKRRKFGRKQKDAIVGISLLLPSVLVIAVTAMYPLAKGISFSFYRLRGFAYEGSFVGLYNYIHILRDPLFVEAFKKGLVWTIGTLTGQILIGLVTALILNKSFIGRSVARGIVLFPYIVPTIVAVIVWRWMLHDQYGIINLVLVRWMGLQEPVSWLATPNLAMMTLILVGVWKFFPFATICFLARLQIIPSEYYDAAKVDGASTWKQFWYITLPQLREIFFVVVLLRGIFMYVNFELPWLLTGGGPGTSTYTLPILSYINAFNIMDRGISAAIASVLFLSLAGVALLYFLAFGRSEQGKKE